MDTKKIAKNVSKGSAYITSLARQVTKDVSAIQSALVDIEKAEMELTNAKNEAEHSLKLLSKINELLA